MAAAGAGLRLLEWGIPLTDLLDLARRHNEATEATARQAVEMFARHVREPLRSGARPDALSAGRGAASARDGDPAVDGLLQAYAELLPAVNTLVGHHFTRTLVRVALDHVEQEGSDEEREAVWDRIRRRRDRTVPSTPPGARADDGRRHPAGDRTSTGISLEAAARARQADLPDRAGEDRPRAVDVRRHRPPLRPRQPRHDLRPRRPLAQAVAAGPRAARRVDRARPRLRHGRLPQAARAPAATVRSAWTSRGACWRPTAPGSPWPRPTAPHCPVATAAVDGITCGYALRNFTELAARLRRVRPHRPARRPHQPARGGRARRRPAPPR